MTTTTDMKYYITKYALTSGVIVLTEDQVIHNSDSMISTTKGFYHKPDWYTSQEEAKAHILHMIEKKLISLEKQKQKLVQLNVDTMLVILTNSHWDGFKA